MSTFSRPNEFECVKRIENMVK